MRSVESAECGKCRTFQFQYEINNNNQSKLFINSYVSMEQ